MYKIKQKSDRARYWFGRIENRYLSCGSQRDIFEPGQGDDGVCVNTAEVEFGLRINEFVLGLVRLRPTMRVWARHFSFFEFEVLSRANVY
jgi:hypothetical protein